MDAISAMPAAGIDVDRFPVLPRPPRSTTFPCLAAAMDELAEYIRRQPDITLGELRAAFLGTGFEWGRDGKLAFCAARRAFIEEFDALIEIHGWDAPGAGLLP